jgi:hypothetical protein
MSCSGGHLGFPIGIKNRNCVEDLPMIIPGQFGFNCPSGFREEALKMFQNASSLKPLGQLKPNCPGMIIGRSSTQFLFFMPIGNPRWPPLQDIDYINKQKLCRGPSNDHSWAVWFQLY